MDSDFVVGRWEVLNCKEYSAYQKFPLNNFSVFFEIGKFYLTLLKCFTSAKSHSFAELEYK